MRSIISCCLIAAGVAACVQAQTVRFYISEGGTAVGSIDVTLNPTVAPLTVANFLTYMNAGDYTNSIFHRSVPGFIIQAGGYQLQMSTGTVVATPQNAAIANEYSLSNVKGTIAMALTSGSTASATNEWFFNVANNASTLNSQSFAVFGQIVATTGSPNGLALMTAINNLPVFTEAVPGLSTSTYGDFADIPLVNGYIDGATIGPNNYVYVTSVSLVPVTTELSFVDAASSVASLFNGIAPGELLTIYGQGNPQTTSSLGPSTAVSYTASSPVGTTLGNTQVLFNNVPGTMLYSSSGQVNVIAPFEIAGSSAVNVVIEYQGTPSAPYAFNVTPFNPAILTLSGTGKGDAAIVDNTTGKVISSSNPASVGEILALFGEGQGVMTPALADGVIVGGTLAVPVAATALLIDGVAVPTYYVGAAPGDPAGVLQVDFAVPQLAAGSHQIQLQVGTGANAVISPTGVTLATR